MTSVVEDQIGLKGCGCGLRVGELAAESAAKERLMRDFSDRLYK